MNKTKKKGFTIVELVIVIAVIAILAAVLIPTFSGLIKKANQSADIQAVRQMNTVLATYSDGSVTNVADAIKALDKENIDLDNYKPLQKDHYFYFYMENGTPKIVYTDKDNNVVYPENVNTKDVQLMSLSGDVPMSSEYIATKNGNEYTVSNGAEFAHLMNNYKGEALEITLDGDIDLLGATVNFKEVKNNITIDAANHTISGMRADTNAVIGEWADLPKDYGFAMFGKVYSGVQVEINNAKFSDIVVKDTAGQDKPFGHSAVLFGSVEGTVVIKNVTIDNCAVYGGDKVGSLIGCLGKNASATLENVKVTNTKVYGLGFIATAIGCVDKEAKNVTISNVDCYGVTTGIYEEKWSTVWYSGDKNWVTGEDVKIDEVKAYVSGSENTYLPWINKQKRNKETENEKIFDFWQLQGMTTKYLYWFDNKTHEDVIGENDVVTDVKLLEKYKVTIEGKEGGYKVSGNESIGQ